MSVRTPAQPSIGKFTVDVSPIAGARVYDFLTKTETVGFAAGALIVKATVHNTNQVLGDAGFEIGNNGHRSWLFTHIATGRVARMHCMADGHWRLSADTGFLDEALVVLNALAQTVQMASA